MTLKEIKAQYNDELRATREKYRQSVNDWLKENNYAGLVRRKHDGKIGWIDLDYDNDLNFYARTKNGIRSLKSSGYVVDVEDDFEPVTEGDTV